MGGSVYQIKPRAWGLSIKHSAVKSNYWCDVLTASGDHAWYSSGRLVVKVSIDVSNFSSQTLKLLYAISVCYLQYVTVTVFHEISDLLQNDTDDFTNSYHIYVEFKVVSNLDCRMVSLWYLVCISLNKINHYKEPNQKIIWSLTKLLKKKHSDQNENC